MNGVPPFLPQGYQYFWYDEIDSTNMEALRHSTGGKYADSWFCAKRQRAGRGTSGNMWESEVGNLYASLLTQLSCSPMQLAQTSLLAGLAAITAIEQLASDDYPIGDLCLKWPNDILLKGRKVCGILVESRPSAIPKQFDTIIGSGINLKTNPEIPGLFPAGNLAQNGWTCTREQLFSALVKSTRDWFTIWRNGEGFDDLRLAWMERSCHIGHLMKVKVGENVYEGRFTTLSHEGALVLEDEGGQKKSFSSGHIVEIEGLRNRT